MSGMDALLGSGMPMCKVISEKAGEEFAVHWWKSDASEGDPCLCGRRHKSDDSAARSSGGRASQEDKLVSGEEPSR